MGEYTRERIEKAFEDSEFHEAMEIAVGLPCKLAIDFKNDQIFVHGPKATKSMGIGEFLEIAESRCE